MNRLDRKGLMGCFLCVCLAGFRVPAQPEQVRHHFKGQFAPFEPSRLSEKGDNPLVDIPDRGSAMHHEPAAVSADPFDDNMRYETSSDDAAAHGQNLGTVAEFENVGLLTTLTPEDKMKIEVEVTLRFSNDRIVVSEKRTSKIVIEIPYASVTQASYELAARHRVAEGAALGIISLGAGMILMTTKTRSHWLVIEYKELEQNKMAVLHLDKGEYKDVINAIESKAGTKVEMLGEGARKVAITQGSKNVDKTVNYEVDRVRAALRNAMEEFGCSICKENKTELQCKRAWGEHVQGLYGVGGEGITAKLDAKGNQTRVRINTGKGLLGRAVKRNWSTPIFNGMIKNLEAYKDFESRD